MTHSDSPQDSIAAGNDFIAVQKDFEAIRAEIAKAVVGCHDTIEGVVTALILGGHVLLEGPPGVGKTLLAETLAQITGLPLQRIPFTPDLMPADILGTHVVMENAQGRRTFEFREGPLFANVVLAEHLNRGTPKTQSALLEAMESDEVSVSNERFRLPQPFLVVGSQNPLEMEGTFPLPEPQLDRFLFKLSVTPPDQRQFEAILDRLAEPAEPVLRQVVDGPRLLQIRAVVHRVGVPAESRRQALTWITALQPDSAKAHDSARKYLRYGVSVRGAQALISAARVRAVTQGRDRVAPADLQAVVVPTLRHRLILNYEGQAEEVSVDRLLREVVGLPAA